MTSRPILRGVNKVTGVVIECTCSRRRMRDILLSDARACGVKDFKFTDVTIQEVPEWAYKEVQDAQ